MNTLCWWVAEESGSRQFKRFEEPCVSPFEVSYAMYSLAKYGDDPTPLLTPFYLLFFGMMVADVGYRLVLFIGTFLALKL